MVRMVAALLSLNVRKFIIHQVRMTMARTINGLRELTGKAVI